MTDHFPVAAHVEVLRAILARGGIGKRFREMLQTKIVLFESLTDLEREDLEEGRFPRSSRCVPRLAKALGIPRALCSEHLHGFLFWKNEGS